MWPVDHLLLRSRNSNNFSCFFAGQQLRSSGRMRFLQSFFFSLLKLSSSANMRDYNFRGKKWPNLQWHKHYVEKEKWGLAITFFLLPVLFRIDFTVHSVLKIIKNITYQFSKNIFYTFQNFFWSFENFRKLCNCFILWSNLLIKNSFKVLKSFSKSEKSWKKCKT